VTEAHRPIELIHARNFVTGLSTPAFLVDADGALAFYNDAASVLLGRRFEEMGQSDESEWATAFQALDEEGNELPLDALPLVRALRRRQAAFDKIRFRAADGVVRDIHVTAIPILTSRATHGALALFWSEDD